MSTDMTTRAADGPSTTACGYAPPSAIASLERLIAQAAGTGIDTSEGLLFNHTVWGRDRVITALDVIDWRPELARQSILALARQPVPIT